MDNDALVGLRFELNGGLGRMAGVVVGKAGALYLVQRDDAQHLELLELSDLRSAKFHATSGTPGQVATRQAASGQAAPTPTAVRQSTGTKLSDKIRLTRTLDEIGSN